MTFLVLFKRCPLIIPIILPSILTVAKQAAPEPINDLKGLWQALYTAKNRLTERPTFTYRLESAYKQNSASEPESEINNYYDS